MTALKPVENRNVEAVASERYPSNKVCAHPHCTELVDLRPNGDPTVHHTFPRSQINGDSYFVRIEDKVYPHAVGLCGSGTTGHHGDVEDHRAWIKFEDGVFVWYDRIIPDGGEMGDEGWEVVPEAWIAIGPLNPQPGSVEGKTKYRKPKASTPEEREKRVNTQIKTPVGEKNVLPELISFAQDLLQKEMESEKRPLPYATSVAVFTYFIEALKGEKKNG